MLEQNIINKESYYYIIFSLKKYWELNSEDSEKEWKLGIDQRSSPNKNPKPYK